MANMFGTQNGTNTEGDGTTQGDGQKKNPLAGYGTSGNGKWSLEGRGLRGDLPQPSNEFKQEGRVIVEIRVNAAGSVISATIKGGDISDKQTQALALEAARKAKFTESKSTNDQTGTITYNFKFN